MSLAASSSLERGICGPSVKLERRAADLGYVSTAADTPSIGLDPEAQRVVEERRARRLSRLASRDRTTLIVSSGLFVAVAGAMAVLMPSERSPSFLAVALLVVLYAITFRCEFASSSIPSWCAASFVSLPRMTLSSASMSTMSSM